MLCDSLTMRRYRNSHSFVHVAQKMLTTFAGIHQKKPKSPTSRLHRRRHQAAKARGGGGGRVDGERADSWANGASTLRPARAGDRGGDVDRGTPGAEDSSRPPLAPPPPRFHSRAGAGKSIKRRAQLAGSMHTHSGGVPTSSGAPTPPTTTPERKWRYHRVAVQ